MNTIDEQQPAIEAPRLEAPVSTPDNGAEQREQGLGTEHRIQITADGIYAINKGTFGVVYSRDGTELFAFSFNAMGFQRERIGFLLELYLVGYRKGRLIGQELVKAKMREVLGPEI